MCSLTPLFSSLPVLCARLPLCLPQITDVPPHRAVELLPSGTAFASRKIQIGDLLVQVDGEDVSHKQIEYIRSIIRGPRNTEVRLKFARTAAGRQSMYEVGLMRITTEGSGETP